MTTINTSHYFIPSVREGLATHIKESAGGHRAQLGVVLTAKAQKKGTTTFDSATISPMIELYGPGDIIGFDKRIVVRTEPKPDSGNFEPNYFPAIEFADPDFVWRYTAKAAEENGNLQPWITLIVLISETQGENIQPEFKEGIYTDRRLPRHIEVDPQFLPNLSEAYRWAHVHVTGNENLTSPQLLEILKREPERTVSRLLRARRLSPGTRYTAFVVPTFKLGVMVGLGCELDNAINALIPAWGGDGNASPKCSLFTQEGKLRLPYYYRWDFRTGLRGDFEHLVRLLERRKLTNLGLRKIDCAKPGFGIPGVEWQEAPESEKHHLDMEGALQSLDTKYTSWGYDEDMPEEGVPPQPNDFQLTLANLLNKSNTEDMVSRDEFTLTIEPVDSIIDITGQVSAMGDQVQITWRTNDPASSKGEVWRDDIEDAPKQAFEDSELKTEHALMLDRLIPDKTYIFKISVTQADGVSIETGNGNFTMPPLPVVAPPVYGRWHMGRLTEDGKIVDAEDQRYWLEHLNLDPRHRAAAGLGAEVIRKNQEPLMADAWDQLGAIESANDLLRRMQLGRDASQCVHKRLEYLSYDEYVRVTSAAQQRIITIDEENKDHLSTAIYLRKRTRIPSASLDPAFSRITGKRRAIAKRQKIMRPQASLRQAIFQRFAEGSLAAAGPVPVITGPATVAGISQRLLENAQLEGSVPVAPNVLSGATGVIGIVSGLRFHERLMNANMLKGILETRPLDNIHTIPNIEHSAETITEVMSNWLDQRAEKSKPAEKTNGFVENVQNHIAKQLEPNVTFVERAKNRLRLSGKIARRFAADALGDPLEPILWGPEFETAMYQPLRDIAHNLLLPGVEKIPQNTIGVLKSNRRFIEAYLCGCNHEFAGELLWRGYPTDQRGSYFRQFWDVSEYTARDVELNEVLQNWLGSKGHSQMNEVSDDDKLYELARDPDRTLDILIEMWLGEQDSIDNLTEAQKNVIKEIENKGAQAFFLLSAEEINALTKRIVIAEGMAKKLRDIQPLHEWGQSVLGSNTNDTQGKLILVIRGDLLRRYPNALVYAIDAATDSNGDIVPSLAEYVTPTNAGLRVFPVFRADLPPDLTFFGFPFTEGAAQAQNGGLGKFFVLEESPGEPRFGADTPIENIGQLENPDGLSWSHFGFGNSEQDAYFGRYIDTPPDTDLGKFGNLKELWINASSAQRAIFTFQKPMRIAIHADQMLP